MVYPGSDSDEERTCGDYLVISTSSLVFQTWKIFIIFLSFFSSFDYARQAALLYSGERNAADIEEGTRWNVYYSVVFSIDMLVCFFTEYHSPTEAEVERNWKKLAVIYLKGRFLLDFLALVPFQTILEFVLAG